MYMYIYTRRVHVYQRETRIGEWNTTGGGKRFATCVLYSHLPIFRERLLSGKRSQREEAFLIESILAQIHCIIVMTRWTGLAPWDFEFPFTGSLTSTFLGRPRNSFMPQEPACCGFRVSCFEFQDSGFRVPDSEFRVPDSGIRVPCSRFRFRILGFRSQGCVQGY